MVGMEAVGKMQGVGSWETLFVLLSCATNLVESSQGELIRGAACYIVFWEDHSANCQKARKLIRSPL